MSAFTIDRVSSDLRAVVSETAGWHVVACSGYATPHELQLLIDVFEELQRQRIQRVLVDLCGAPHLYSGFFGLLYRAFERHGMQIHLTGVGEDVRRYYWFKGLFTQVEAGVFELVDTGLPVLSESDEDACSDAESGDASDGLDVGNGDCGRMRKDAA